MKVVKNKILVADDEESIRMLLTEALSDENYEVVAVEDGLKAVEKAQKGTSIVCCLDVRMPGLDGMQVFLKIHESNPNLPVIFLTAYGSSDLAIQAMKKGAYDYLTKPFDIEELKIKVKKAIELKELTEKSPEIQLNEKNT